MIGLLENLHDLPLRDRVGCLVQCLAFLTAIVVVTVATVLYGM